MGLFEPDQTESDKPLPQLDIIPRTITQFSGDKERKQAAFAVLRQAGLGPSQAATAMGLSPTTGSRYDKKLNAYEIRRDILLKKSVQTLEKFSQGQAIGGEIMIDPGTGQPRLDRDTGKPLLKGAVMPKGSDVMRAIENVLDREQPKVALSASISAEFMPIDLELYR